MPPYPPSPLSSSQNCIQYGVKTGHSTLFYNIERSCEIWDGSWSTNHTVRDLFLIHYGHWSIFCFPQNKNTVSPPALLPHSVSGSSLATDWYPRLDKNVVYDVFMDFLWHNSLFWLWDFWNRYTIYLNCLHFIDYIALIGKGFTYFFSYIAFKNRNYFNKWCHLDARTSVKVRWWFYSNMWMT